MASSRYGQGGGGGRREGELNREKREKRAEPGWLLFMVELYQSPPSEVPCDQCVLRVLSCSVLYL